MDHETAKRITLETLQHAVNGRLGQVCENVKTLCDTGDLQIAYLACCGWAGSSEVALERIHGPAGTWTPSDIRTGGLDDRPEKTFALRFITAYSNDDPDTTEALFVAAVNSAGDQFAKCLISLLMTAADLNAQCQPTAEAQQ
jgi:hypothetical protein